MNHPQHLNFFITLNKLTDELTIQERGLLSFKIPKQWQKPDSDVKQPALWVCHLPTNSLGIVYVSLYPNELVIKKKIDTTTNYSEEEEEIDKELKEYEYDENLLIIYKGFLEPNGENEKERFYRCKLKLQEQQEQKKASNWQVFLLVITIIIIVFIVIGVIVNINSGNSRGYSYRSV
jgi:hypothetical protein